MKEPPQRSGSQEDEVLESLLGAVGPRGEVPADVMAQVRDSVHAEWRAVIQVRQQRRRVFAYGLAASGVFALLITIGFIVLTGNGAPVATVARVIGTLEASDGGTGDWRTLVVGEQIKAGQVLRAGANGRAALTTRSGIQLRLDADSHVEFSSAQRLALARGAVYIDADPRSAQATPFEVRTALGAVSHVGTQFEVRSRGRLVEIKVREGSVRLRSDSGEHVATAGERLRVSARNVERARISLQDPSWQWALQVAPEFTIEGVPLADFLHWVARETGRKLVFSSTDAAETARRIILHGSIGQLSAEAALPAVLATTQLTHAEADEHSIRIALKDM